MVDGARQVSRTPDENAIVKTLSGGLNVVSSTINTPDGDSPILKNVEVNDSGNLQSRSGTQHLYEYGSSSSTIGFSSMSYISKAGYNLVVTKEGRHLRIFQLTATEAGFVDSFQALFTKLEVFPEVASNVKFDYVVTNESNSRIIFTTGIAAPVQLTFVELSKQVSTGTPLTSVVFDSPLLQYANTANAKVWINGDIANVSSMSYSSGQLTVNLGSFYGVGTFFIDIVYVSWQWWAEAAISEGRYLYQSQTRFTADSNDLSVAVPTDLLVNYQVVTRAGLNILPYKDSSHGAYYTFKTDFIPTTEDEFNFSQGITYNPADSKAIVPGISHVTFGVLPSAPEEVHFVKALPLSFNGGTGIANNDLLVYVDDTLATQRTVTGSGTGDWGDVYYLRNIPGTSNTFYSTSSIVTDGTTKANFITFDATTSVGLGFNQQVKIINSNDNGFAGSNATANYNGDFTPRDGNLFPAYGFYEWADYSSGSFPRTVELYQGRIVFGGFPNKPLFVVFSNTFDSTTPDVFFNNFSVATEDGQSTDGLSVFVSAVDNDAAITAIISYAQSLFVFTKNKLIRLYGGSSGITPNSITSSVIASVGALNAQCVSLVDNSVLFLSNSGVNQLAPSIQVGDFTVRPVSAKIVTLLQNNRNSLVAWIAYDRGKNRLYVAVTDDSSSVVCTKLYCLSLFREAWWEIAMFYGDFYTSGATVIQGDQTFLLFSSLRSKYTTTSSYDLLAHPYFYSIDYGKETQGEVTSESFDLVFADQFTYTRFLDFLPTSFTTLPIDIEDVKLLIDGTEASFNNDYYKRDKKLITLNPINLIGGETLLLHPVSSEGIYPVAFYVDNIRQSDFTVAVTSSSVVATVNFDNPFGTRTRYGYTYPCIAGSPLLIRNTISRAKVLRHLYVLLRNEEYFDVYSEDDVNDFYGQTLEALLGKFKREVGLNIGIQLERSSNSYNNNQTFAELYYDIGRFDSDSPNVQLGSHTKLGFPLRGHSNHINVVFYTYDDKVWELVAYELEAQYAARSSKNAWN